MGGGLSTFAETAALLGGGRLSVCRSMGYGHAAPKPSPPPRLWPVAKWDTLWATVVVLVAPASDPSSQARAGAAVVARAEACFGRDALYLVYSPSQDAMAAPGVKAIEAELERSAPAIPALVRPLWLPGRLIEVNPAIACCRLTPLSFLALSSSGGMRA